MNTIKTMIVASLATASLWAQSNTQSANPPVTTSIDRLELVAITSDHARFDLHARVTATRNITVARIRFEEMRLGEIPFYLSPVDQKMELKSGQEAMLPAIAMTIYYRDLDTLEPLEEVVRNGEIRVRGRADADLDLSLLEKLALRRWSGHADVPIDDRIEVSLPGGFAGRAAALLALNAGEAAMDLAGSTLNALRITQRKWNGELKTEFGESLLVVESSYRMRTTEGQELAGNFRSLGFRIADGRVLVTAETAEPWKYDVDTMELLRSKKATIIENSHNIAVWAPNGNIDSAASLANGRLRVEKIATSEESVIVREDGKNRTVPVAKRDARSNYALLRFAEEQEKRGGIPVEPTRADQMWDRVAVFKLNSDGTIETIFIPARRQGDRLILDTPVDDGTFGSPIVVPGGAIGMVQDEHSGMVLPTKW